MKNVGVKKGKFGARIAENCEQLLFSFASQYYEEVEMNNPQGCNRKERETGETGEKEISPELCEKKKEKKKLI